MNNISLHTLLVCLLALMSSAAVAQDGSTAEDLISQSVEALGGMETIKEIETMRLTGDIQMPSMGQEMSLTLEQKRPNKMRSEVFVPSVGATITSGYDGETAWMVNPMSGGAATEVTGPQADQVQRNAEFDSPLIGYKEKGITAEYLGDETVEGTDMKKLKLVRLDSSETVFYLDAETMLPVRTVTQGQDPTTGQPADVVTELTDYRDVGGLMMPFKMTVSVDGSEFQVLTFDDVTANQPIPDTRFEMPKGDASSGDNW